MKVLIVGREYPPFSVGGIATHTYTLVKHLRKLGVEVTVVAFGDPRASTDSEVFLSPASSLMETGATNLYKDLLLTWDIARLTSFTKKLLHEKHFDIVHVQEPYVGGLVTYDDRKVTTIHTTGISDVKSILKTAESPNPQVFKKTVFYVSLGYFMEYASIFTSKIIIAPSYICKQELVNMYKVHPSRIVVIHNGVEIPLNIPSKEEARKMLGLPKDKVLVLTVGRHVTRKRINLLIEAIYRLDKSVRDNIFVIIIGKGYETPFLIQLTEKRCLSDVVKFLGYVPDEKLWLYYSASDIFALTSDMESAPMVLLEAAIMGNAIVTSRTGDYALMMKNGVDGLIFEPGDVNTLTRFLEELIVDENLRHTFSRNARLFASRFTADKMARKTLKIYEKLITSK
jgi:glycosyltransferase involved in cell wall biosynthesis